ncbi:Conserved_hypothetical protein [Hexamita inflata]|uniref:Uncharacterized protein n=1 Tax=Hexamita inflata TaxID=28002 RepID=A0AA86TPJ2_9EUKA|nr:Conserved hypothetical protein [Hexamita inflata]
MADTLQEKMVQEAAILYNFVIYVCNDKGKSSFVDIFSKNVQYINSCEEKKLCSLLRLYNTFHDFEPMVLVHLNEFLPLDLRYDITHDPLNVELPPILVEHMATCPELHMAPEEDLYPQTLNLTVLFFVDTLNQIVPQPIAEQFKLLLSRFVQSQPDTSTEVLQFIVQSAELISEFPELLAGLLIHLGVAWQNYAVEMMKFVSIQQIAKAYGVYENVSSQDTFRRIVECIELNKLNDTQLQWRANLILHTQNQTKLMRAQHL